MAVTTYAPADVGSPALSLAWRRLPVLIGTVFLLPLLVVAYSGTLARYVADDFCTATVVLDHGYLGALGYWYVSWSGRFAFFLFVDVVNLAGEWTVPLTPVFLLLAWGAVSALTIRRLTNRAASWTWSAVLAIALVSATVALAPSLWQSVYWQTGSLTYLLPLILLTAFVAVALHIRSMEPTSWGKRLWQLLGAALVALSVGCSETSMALVDAALIFAAAVLYVRYRRGHRDNLLATLVAALVAAAIASLIVSLAPGNHVRGGMLSAFRPELWDGALLSLAYPLVVLAEMLLFRAPGYVLLVYAVAFVAGHASGTAAPKGSKTLQLLIWVGGYLCMAAAGAPSFFVVGGRPPARAEIETVTAVIVVILASGYLAGLRQERRAVLASRPAKRMAVAVLGTVAVALTVISGPVMTTVNNLARTSELQAYAADIEQAESLARSAHASGASQVVVDQMRLPEMVNLADANPAATENHCPDQYFGVVLTPR